MNVPSSANLFERAINESASDRVAEPVFRVTLNEVEHWNPRNRIKNPVSTCKFNSTL